MRDFRSAFFPLEFVPPSLHFVLTDASALVVSHTREVCPPLGTVGIPFFFREIPHPPFFDAAYIMRRTFFFLACPIRSHSRDWDSVAGSFFFLAGDGTSSAETGCGRLFFFQDRPSFLRQEGNQRFAPPFWIRCRHLYFFTDSPFPPFLFD